MSAFEALQAPATSYYFLTCFKAKLSAWPFFFPPGYARADIRLPKPAIAAGFASRRSLVQIQPPQRFFS